MEITVTLKEGRLPLHGPEVSNNLPKGVGVKYQVQLATAIKDAVVDATKAKAIKNALNAAIWKVETSSIKDAMAKEAPNGIVGKHTIKFKVDGSALAVKPRLLIGSAESKGADAAMRANGKAAKQAKNELASLRSRFPDLVAVKVGDKQHPKNVIYTLTIGEERRTGSIPDAQDTHIKETSRKRALGDWVQARKDFVAYQRSQS